VRKYGPVSSALTPTAASYVSLLRRPRYPGFVLTVLLARVSGTMFITTGVLLVLARTGSAPLAGATAAASTLPGALSGPVLGAWLDVARRRRVLIVADQLLTVAGLVAIVVLAGHAPGWTVPAAAVVYSVTRPFSSGSFFSALAELAGPELLDAASAIEASSLNVSFLVGPALGGVLAGAAGPAAAIEVQAGLTLLVLVLIAINPAFEVRPEQVATTISEALRDGVRALRSEPLLRASGIGSVLAAFGWGLMMVGFPLYAVRTLHAPAHNSGFMWAAVALGSTLGTFVLRGDHSRARISISYAVLGASALLWPLAHALALGVLLIGVTGFLEGPAYSGTIALRQRLTPPAVRAQVMTTLSGSALVAASLSAAIGGLIHRPLPLILAFTAINFVAAVSVAGVQRGARRPAGD
jgi:MFS family permease